MSLDGHPFHHNLLKAHASQRKAQFDSFPEFKRKDAVKSPF